MVSMSNEELSFKPKINQNSSLIASYKRNYNQETLEQKIQRISDEALDKKNKLHEKLQSEHYEQYSFEPKINPLSRQLAKTTNLSNYQEDLRNKKKIKAQASVAELQKICSFSPKLHSPSRYSEVVSAYRQGENIVARIQKTQIEKNRLITNVKKEEEVENMSQCTFKPKTISRIRSDSSIKVKGVDRFNELRTMAKKQQYDKQVMEKKLLYRDCTRELVYTPY
jgi:hypothetical protein